MKCSSNSDLLFLKEWRYLNSSEHKDVVAWVDGDCCNFLKAQIKLMKSYWQ